MASTVSVFLSLKKAAPSSANVAGADQVRPPSLERLASIALRLLAPKVLPLTARPIRCAVPSLPISTQGSLARSKSPLLPGAAPPQRDSGCKVRTQVAPPSKLVALTSARAAPSLQRSCCQAATRCCALAGARASEGSTSASA